MIGAILLHTGAALIALWGIAHMVPTRQIVAGFGDISIDNRRIATMTWIAEGLMLVFVGWLVFMATMFLDPSGSAATLVYYSAIGILIISAALSSVTGARTPVVPMKMCPFVKITAAALIATGSVL